MLVGVLTTVHVQLGGRLHKYSYSCKTVFDNINLSEPSDTRRL